MERKKGGQKDNKNAAKNPKEKRTNRSFKATDEEYNSIKARAETANMTISEFIRYKTILK